jgi:hypothetical protein
MGLFHKLKEPTFLKEESDGEKQLDELKKIYVKVSSNIKPLIEKDIKMMSYGMKGEENIAFELRNSHMPMYILHDLHLEHNGLRVQIDYLVITRKRTFIIECKNLIGNIEINNRGDFIRTLYYNGNYKKEGIYSPITQNNRHMEVLKDLRLDCKKNFLTKALFEKNFYDMYSSIVVLANPKTVLNDRYAKKEIKEQVIRADQLIEYIKKANNETNMNESSDKRMLQLAQFYLDSNKPNKINYCDKYSDLIYKDSRVENKKELKSDESISQYKINNTLFIHLKEYRLNKSREENIKPYLIYNNKQMDSLMIHMPKDIGELKNISGFGEVKVDKYGEDILEILNKY